MNPAPEVFVSRSVAPDSPASPTFPFAKDNASHRASPEALARVPVEIARKYLVYPLRIERGSLHLLTDDALNLAKLDEIGHAVGCHIEPVEAPAETIRRAIERGYGTTADPGSSGIDGESDSTVLAIVERLLTGAVDARASDIHLEPLEKRFRVRYRIDGALVEAPQPSREAHAAVISRLKIMADMSIAEKRLPQDGRVRLPLGRRSLDLRVSTIPTVHGESMVIRILDSGTVQLGLAELGMEKEDQRLVEQILGRPDGLVLVTGPTGSGKTTTLYSFLRQLNRTDRKIITVEDPVEYQLPGVNQVPVRAETGVTFASALRAMLRQSPDVIMVGEIRDLETAEIAINAAMTGHLVISTLHTNDAAGAVTRLIDLGVKPFLVAAALRAVVAQRLVRRICRCCAQVSSKDVFAESEICPDCLGTGFHGRVGLYEILNITPEIQEAIHECVGVSKIRECARRAGIQLLRDDGLRKVAARLTTEGEIACCSVD